MDNPAARPCISVVMSVFNGEPLLSEAVESILGQTFGDFEFIIINDGSTDGSGETLQKFARQDDRIRLVEQPNRGLNLALNDGIDAARGKYLARMDADDISLPERLAQQHTFLETHPEIGVVGVEAVWFMVDGRERRDRWMRVHSPDHARWRLLFQNCMIHPSVMGRTELFKRYRYCPDTRVAQDYELWLRMSLQENLVNMPEPLLAFRRTQRSVGATQRNDQRHTAVRVQGAMIKDLLGEEVPRKFVREFHYLSFGQCNLDGEDAVELAQLMLRIHDRFCRRYRPGFMDRLRVGSDLARFLYASLIKLRSTSNWRFAREMARFSLRHPQLAEFAAVRAGGRLLRALGVKRS